MYTIGQFSRICHVTVKALRHYEKVGLIAPARVEPGNQYRYYTREQVDVVAAITHMKELGFSLKAIKQIVNQDPGSDGMRDILTQQRRLLMDQIHLHSSRLTRLAWWQRTLEARDMTEPRKYEVAIKEVPAVQVYSIRKALTDFPKDLTPLFLKALDELQSKGGVCAGPPITVYYDESFDAARVDAGVAWPVSDTAHANGTLAAVTAATVMHVGPYTDLEHAYEALYGWINKNGYRALTPMREINYNDPRVTPPDQLVSEVIVPIEKVGT